MNLDRRTLQRSGRETLHADDLDVPRYYIDEVMTIAGNGKRRCAE
ncbi:MAG: hypothetical protein R3E73_09615 [Porticoccaceae bacterium]